MRSRINLTRSAIVALKFGLWIAQRHFSSSSPTMSNSGGNRFRLYFNVFLAAISRQGCKSVSFHSIKNAGRPTRLIIVRRNDRFGFSAGTEAAPITGAPAVHCWGYIPAITANRASRTVRLSAQVIMDTTCS